MLLKNAIYILEKESRLIKLKNKNLDYLYKKLDDLERKRMMYLEVDDNSSANRIQRQIVKMYF